MKRSGDYGSEMVDETAHDELQELLRAGSVTEVPLSPVADFIAQFRSLGVAPPDDVVAQHLTMLGSEAASNPAGAPVPQGSSGPPVRRRRIAFGTLMSGFLVKALIGTAAFAAVGTGAAVGSDGAVPGDALYGLDRALERVGINHGGASERIEEAMVLVDRGTHGRALETIQEAVEDLAGDPGDAGAVAALQNAADHIATIRSTGATGYGDTQAFRDQVAGFLNAIAADMEDGKVDGAMVAENARQFSATARSFAESRGAAPDEAGPPGPGTSSGPPDPGPGNKPDEPPGQADRDDRRP